MDVKSKKNRIKKFGWNLTESNKNSGYKIKAVKGSQIVQGTSITNLYDKIFKKGYR